MDRISTLLARARDATGLADFGEETFREGLEVLVRSADAEARLNERGRQSLDGQIVSLLSRRLEIEDWYGRHPEIDEQEIVAPLIGLGLPRTGSTALSCLLAEDPAVRSLRTWESGSPCPPPEAATQDTDPRLIEAQRRSAQSAQYLPKLRAMLPLSPTAPTECQTLMGFDFRSHLFQATLRVPTYSDWLNNKADLVSTFRYVKRVLKLLQWRCPPNRWRLKNPSHTVFINALDKVFPDARYWMTHRDIASVIPSVVELYYQLGKGNSDQVERDYLIQLNEDCWELGMRRVIAFREAGAESRFFDIHFAPFQRDPFPTLERLYQFLGEDFTDETRQRMERWRKETPREARVEYETTGIDFVELRKRFQFYADRFGVEPTAAA